MEHKEWKQGRKSPCWYCHKRNPGCHDRCESHQHFVEEHRKEEQWLKAQMRPLSYVCQDTIKVFK